MEDTHVDTENKLQFIFLHTLCTFYNFRSYFSNNNLHNKVISDVSVSLMFFDGAEGAAMAQEKKLPIFNIKTTNIIMAKPLIGGSHSHSAKTP